MGYRYWLTSIFFFSFLYSTFCQNGMQGLSNNNIGAYVKIKVKPPRRLSSTYSGYVLEQTNEDSLFIRTRRGSEFNFSFNDIIEFKKIHASSAMDKYIDSDSENTGNKSRLVIIHPEVNYEGLYANFGISYHTANISGFVEAFAGIDMGLGHRFNQYVSFGGGFGIQEYNYDIFTPITFAYLESIGYVSKNKTSPYYRIRFGIGGSNNNAQFRNFQKADPGIFYSPAIGIRIMGQRTLKLNFEYGLMHQEVKYYDLDFGARELDFTYNRFYFSLILSH